MKRREFIGTLTAGAATLALGGFSLEMEGCSTSWITTALNDLPVIVNIATTVAMIVADALGGSVISPAVAAIIQTAAQAVSTGLVVVQQLIAQYQANPSASIIQKIDAALTDVQANLQSILSAAHIDNPALQATIAGIIGLALTVVGAIISILPAPAPVAGGAKVARVPMKPLSPSQIKERANSILNHNGYGNYDLK